MQAPDIKDALALVGHIDELLNDSDAFQTRLKHSCQQLLPVNTVCFFLPILKSKSQLEDVITHHIHNDALVVSHPVLQVNDSLVFEVSVEQGAQVVNLDPERLHVVEIAIMIDSIERLFTDSRFIWFKNSILLVNLLVEQLPNL